MIGAVSVIQRRASAAFRHQTCPAYLYEGGLVWYASRAHSSHLRTALRTGAGGPSSKGVLALSREHSLHSQSTTSDAPNCKLVRVSYDHELRQVSRKATRLEAMRENGVALRPEQVYGSSALPAAPAKLERLPDQLIWELGGS